MLVLEELAEVVDGGWDMRTWGVLLASLRIPAVAGMQIPNRNIKRWDNEMDLHIPDTFRA